MLLTNVRLHQQEGLYDIEFKDGVISAVESAGTLPAVKEVVDAGGKLALPPFIDPHVHLDTCLTAGEPVWNRSGTLFEGIQNWSDRKKNADPC